jgi:hypothetical protein
MKTSILIHHASAVIIITIVCLLIYASVQQGYRTSANDPQIQLASDIKEGLEQSRPIEGVFPKDSIDLTRSLSVFAALYDNNGQPLRASGYLNRAMPVLPPGVLNTAKNNGEDRVTWQPQSGVRMAMVVMKVNAANVHYVAVGRSLKEIERRESDLVFMIFAGWLICIAVILINGAIYFFMKRTEHG